MKSLNKLFFRLPCLIATTVFANSLAHSEPIIHEPFVYATGEINGVPANSGTGLTGTWSATAAGSKSMNHNEGITTVEPSSDELRYGSLKRSGGKLRIKKAANMFVSVDTAALKNAGLLDDGSTLWISFLLRASPDTGANNQQSFAFGTDPILADQFAQKMSNGGSGVGLSFIQGIKLHAAYWDGKKGGKLVAKKKNTARSNTTYLVVLAVTWGASSESIQLYLPETDLVQPEAMETITTEGNLDQSSFDMITYSHRGHSAFDDIDEIRFGASYDDVVVVDPDAEPVSFALLDSSGFFGN